jgi:hypothetical protein
MPINQYAFMLVNVVRRRRREWRAWRAIERA